MDYRDKDRVFIMASGREYYMDRANNQEESGESSALRIMLSTVKIFQFVIASICLIVILAYIY